MVAARARFLSEGHYAPLAERLAELAAAGEGPAREVIADAGAGTGHYLAHLLTARTGAGADAAGIALDVSKHALKRAARAHERIGAVVTDLWRPLPLRDDSVDMLVNVFAPRNSPEFARVLKPGGKLIVVTPGPGHLGELVDRLGLLSVDEDKDRRLAGTLGGHFAQAARATLTTELSLRHEAVEAVVGMGPSAWHLDPATLRREIAELPEPLAVHASFRLTTWNPLQ
jgi:23S rRNA (guanine745-N1)-methyltransferase